METGTVTSETTETIDKQIDSKLVHVERYAYLKLNVNVSGAERFSNKDFLLDIKKYIGASFRSVNGVATSETLIPLTKDEIEVLMPLRIGTDPKDRTKFNIDVENFWREFEVLITGETIINPKKLNICYTKTRCKLLDGREVVLNMPDNLDDWFAYKLAKNSSSVAKTKEERDSPHFWFILEDEKEIIKEEEAQFLIKEKANIHYVSLTTNPKYEDKMKNVIKVFKANGEFTVNKPLNTKVREKEFLSLIKDKDAKLFLDTLEDADLEYKAYLIDLLDYQIFKYDNGFYIYNNRIIGDENETVMYLKNQNNSKDLSTIDTLLKASKKSEK